jgi:hypothetical protein
VDTATEFQCVSDDSELLVCVVAVLVCTRHKHSGSTAASMPNMSHRSRSTCLHCRPLHLYNPAAMFIYDDQLWSEAMISSSQSQ